jgi:hypothetical protein
MNLQSRKAKEATPPAMYHRIILHRFIHASFPCLTPFAKTPVASKRKMLFHSDSHDSKPHTTCHHSSFKNRSLPLIEVRLTLMSPLIAPPSHCCEEAEMETIIEFASVLPSGQPSSWSGTSHYT